VRRVFPHHPIGLGSVVSSPVGSGAEPRPKMDFMHISGQKEAIWNALFSIVERRRGPKHRGARENFPPPPLDGPDTTAGDFQCNLLFHHHHHLFSNHVI